MLPQLAQAQGSTLWVIPSEVTTALKTLSSAFGAENASPPALPQANGELTRAEQVVAAEAAHTREEVAQVEQEVAAVERQVAEAEGATPL
jgi:hypothetical protein